MYTSLQVKFAHSICAHTKTVENAFKVHVQVRTINLQINLYPTFSCPSGVMPHALDKVLFSTTCDILNYHQIKLIAIHVIPSQPLGPRTPGQ